MFSVIISLKYGSSSSLVRSAGGLRRTSCAVRRQQRALLRLLAEPGRGPQLEPAAGDAALGSSLGHGHGSAAERGPRARQRVADFWLGRVGDAAGEVELLKGEVSRLRAEQQWLAISRIPRMPAAEGFSWLDGQNGQVSDRQRRGEAPQYPRQLHPVACAAPRAWTCGSRTCSSCSLTAILSLLLSLIFAVLTARTSLAGRQPFGTPRQRAASAGVT